MRPETKIPAIVLALLCLHAPQLVHSAEDKTASTEQLPKAADKQSAEEEKAKQTGKPKIAPKKAKNNDIFRPSEEISEDFNVSFPVDI